MTIEIVEACINRSVSEREYRAGLRYVGFVDPSGGSADSFTLAIAHRDADSLILDCIREVKPPFSPESVVQEFAGLLKTYDAEKNSCIPGTGLDAAATLFNAQRGILSHPIAIKKRQ